MSRSIILSNDQLCVALDDHALVRDVYYPHVGLENHVRGHYIHRVGVWTDGRLSWLSDGAWNISVRCEDEALVSAITARHNELGIELRFSDTVCREKNIFLRRVIVKNVIDRARDVRLYLGHQFELQKMHGSDTAYFDPRVNAIIHYKGRRVFLIGGMLDGNIFDDFATGRANFQGKEGSHRDAEDGELSRNPIEHGPADSIIGLYAPYAAGQERTCEYWLIAAQSIPEAEDTHAYVRKKTPEQLLRATRAWWREWMEPFARDFRDLAAEHITLFKQSLMYARAHVDVGGGIIASVDSDMFQYGLDTYSYVWTRDAAFVALALDAAGELSVAERFFEFCKDVITSEGYFMHKYLPDKSLGSSWHPWVVEDKLQLPIQEDETAIVTYALGEYMRRRRNRKLLASIYIPLVEQAAEFLMSYRDAETSLPQPSYDLWERKRGTSTYTSAAVYGALKAAAELARLMDKEKEAKRYEKAAKEIQEGILAHLWWKESGMFYNMLHRTHDVQPDVTVDISSVYGVFLFGVLPPNDPRLARAFETTVRRLSEGISAGGIARFENDDYYRIPGPSPGNPWFLTTLWYAEYRIATATTHDDLSRVRDIFTWTAHHALSAGILSEQLNPQTGAQVCAGPLAWAHSTYVRVVLAYLDRWKALSR